MQSPPAGKSFVKPGPAVNAPIELPRRRSRDTCIARRSIGQCTDLRADRDQPYLHRQRANLQNLCRTGENRLLGKIRGRRRRAGTSSCPCY